MIGVTNPGEERNSFFASKFNYSVLEHTVLPIQKWLGQSHQVGTGYFFYVISRVECLTKYLVAYSLVKLKQV